VTVLHTRGPWAVSKNSTGRRITNQTGVVICNAVLRNQGGPKHKAYLKCVEEAEANARVIALSPELLDFAAMIARLSLDSDPGIISQDHDDDAEVLERLIVSARALVAKAGAA
jgi:hypothetical protein